MISLDRSQKAFIALASKDFNIAIAAAGGAGKSTCVAAICDSIFEENDVVLVHYKHLADHLGKKVKKCKVFTIHAFFGIGTKEVTVENMRTAWERNTRLKSRLFQTGRIFFDELFRSAAMEFEAIEEICGEYPCRVYRSAGNPCTAFGDHQILGCGDPLQPGGTGRSNENSADLETKPAVFKSSTWKLTFGSEGQSVPGWRRGICARLTGQHR